MLALFEGTAIKVPDVPIDFLQELKELIASY